MDVHNPTLNIVRPNFPDAPEIMDEFRAILATGQVTNHGPHVQEFERLLTEYLGVPTIVFNSGQSALMAMVRAAGVYQSDVIVPSFTFCGTPHAIRWAGGWPIFADIDPATLTIDPKEVRRLMKPWVKAIIGVDPYGICCDYAALIEIGREYGIPVLIDSAPAFGSTINGQVTGGFADMQIFSFHATKPFSTMEGGALCSHDVELLDRARRIRNFGQYDDGDCITPGINGKMMEVSALVGCWALAEWPTHAKQRYVSGHVLRKKLDGIDGVTVVRAPTWQKPIWTYQPILIDHEKFGKSRDEVMAGLNERGIVTRKYYPACHRMSAYRSDRWDFPVTDLVASQVIALPLYNRMDDGEMDRIVAALHWVKGR